jgi:glycosyltransferase involved in cell wall biosynthesis
MAVVTVAIPVRDGASVLEETLSAVREQQLDPGVELQLLVCDSGSRDGSVAIARRHGAEVFEIPPGEFSHGATRNLLMERAQGEHVAFLSQDAVPADERWLAQLLGGFALARDVGLVFGPYRPRDDASLLVKRELTQWFASLAPDGEPRVDRLGVSERAAPTRSLLGARGYFTDANGCVSRAAWREVPFRPVAYAEDHALAHDMLRAGFAKVYMPDAAVIHSHDYSPLKWLRRSFDEARAIRELYDFSEAGEWRRALLNVWGLVGADVRFARRRGVAHPLGMIARSLPHHLARALGTVRYGARCACGTA